MPTPSQSTPAERVLVSEAKASKSSSRAYSKNLLDLSKPFIIGEKHYNTSPKKFLIEMMPHLQKAGYTTFYMEFLNFEGGMREDLDSFYNTGKMPEMLRRFLMDTDEGHLREKRKSGCAYTDVIIAAQKHGIRIVGMERMLEAAREREKIGKSYPSSYFDYHNTERRLPTLNNSAAHIINDEREKGINKGLWFGLMGLHHLSNIDFPQQFSVKGTAELTGATSVMICEDATAGEDHFSTHKKSQVDQSFLQRLYPATFTDHPELLPQQTVDVSITVHPGVSIVDKMGLNSPPEQQPFFSCRADVGIFKATPIAPKTEEQPQGLACSIL